MGSKLSTRNADSREIWRARKQSYRNRPPTPFMQHRIVVTDAISQPNQSDGSRQTDQNCDNRSSGTNLSLDLSEDLHVEPCRRMVQPAESMEEDRASIQWAESVSLADLLQIENLPLAPPVPVVQQAMHFSALAQPLYLFYDWRMGKLLPNGRRDYVNKSEGMAAGPFVITDGNGTPRIYITGPAHLFLEESRGTVSSHHLTKKVNEYILDYERRVRIQADQGDHRFHNVSRVWICYDPSRGMDWFIGLVEGEHLYKYAEEELDSMSGMNHGISSMTLGKKGFIKNKAEVDELRHQGSILYSASGLELQLRASAPCRLSGAEYSAEYSAEYMLKLEVLRGRPKKSMSGTPVFYQDERFCYLLGQLTGMDSDEVDNCGRTYVFVLPFYHLEEIIMSENENAFLGNIRIPNDKTPQRRQGRGPRPIARIPSYINIPGSSSSVTDITRNSTPSAALHDSFTSGYGTSSSIGAASTRDIYVT